MQSIAGILTLWVLSFYWYLVMRPQWLLSLSIIGPLFISWCLILNHLTPSWDDSRIYLVIDVNGLATNALQSVMILKLFLLLPLSRVLSLDGLRTNLSYRPENMARGSPVGFGYCLFVFLTKLTQISVKLLFLFVNKLWALLDSLQSNFDHELIVDLFNGLELIIHKAHLVWPKNFTHELSAWSLLDLFLIHLVFRF